MRCTPTITRIAKGVVRLWLTGLAGAGKTTIARSLRGFSWQGGLILCLDETRPWTGTRLYCHRSFDDVKSI